MKTASIPSRLGTRLAPIRPIVVPVITMPVADRLNKAQET